MKKYYLSLVITIVSFLSFSQELKSNVTHQIDKGNCREGEDIEYCLTHKKMSELNKQNPQSHEKSNADKVLLDEALAKVKSGAIEKGVVYTIPVVFHVIHDGGIENISKEQILNALDILNRDYRKLNDDANYVVSDFLNIASDTEIEFALATKAPDGTCFDGITRTQDPITFDGSAGYLQVDAIVNGNNVYQGNWSGSKYLNIYVLADVGGAAGYTYRPSGNFGASMNAGIFIQHTYVGSFGTSSEVTSRALTHEVGHWLGLAHTWGSDNNPGVSSSCNQDDNVDDTPLTIGVQSCQKSSNSCDDTNPSNGLSSSWNYDVVDNVENYMDYSYCSKMFTQGQADLMRATLNSSTSGRNNLWKSSNLSSTGAGQSGTLCSVGFSVSSREVCSGQTIDFIDESYSNITSWEWSFPGATPSSSTLQNPSVVYNTPGNYSVILKVYSGNSSLTETKTSYMTVLPASKNLPFFDGFEEYTSIANSNDWSVNSNAGNLAFEVYSNASYTGSKSVRLSNYYESSEAVDELISSNFNLSDLEATDVVTLSFKYSYRKKTSQTFESLKISASTDCGETWSNRQTISGSALSTSVVSNNWIPSSNDDWVTYHVTSIKSPFFVENLRLKFSFEGNGGNNIYLDDINLYKGSPSQDLVLGINEVSEIMDLNLFPNPTEGDLQLNFSIEKNEDVILLVYDVTGKPVHHQLVKAKAGGNVVQMDVNNLSNGMYFLNVKTGGANKVLQFFVK